MNIQEWADEAHKVLNEQNKEAEIRVQEGIIDTLEMEAAALKNNTAIVAKWLKSHFLTEERRKVLGWTFHRIGMERAKVAKALDEEQFKLTVLRMPPPMAEAVRQREEMEFAVRVAELRGPPVRPPLPGPELVKEGEFPKEIAGPSQKLVAFHQDGIEKSFMDHNGMMHDNPPERCWCRREMKHIIVPRVEVPLTATDVQAKNTAAMFRKPEVRDFLRTLGKVAFKRWLDCVLDEAVRRGRKFTERPEDKAAIAIAKDIEANVYKELKGKKLKMRNRLVDLLKDLPPAKPGRKS